MNQNDINAINEIKALGLDMIKKFGSGSAGIVLSSAPILYTLYTRHLKVNPENPEWFNRDRFVLSASHASSLLYATLFVCGFPLKREELQNFGKIDSNLPLYPEYNTTPGVDITTNIFGDGIASAIGIALAERYISNLLKEEDDHQKLLDFYTYVLCSDKELMNGIFYEATSFAGAQKLNKLIVLCDYSKITNDGETKDIFIDDLVKRFEAINFYVEIAKSSENVKIIDKAINNAKKSKKPSILIFNTTLGKDSLYENNNVIYKNPLNDDDLFTLKKKLNITMAPFEVRKDTLIYVQKLIKDRIEKKYQENISIFNKYKNYGNDRLIAILAMLTNKTIPLNFDSNNYKINDTYNENLLLTNHKILNIVANKTELLLGGNLDLSLDTKAYLDNTAKNTFQNPLGRNIDFGSRELAASAILNGVSTLGLRTFCSTTLVNSDLMKPTMRLSALINLPITYIFTHDSMFNEKSATISPVEQLNTLRAIPNMVTIRPCDINEILGSWEYICKSKKTISLVLGNNTIPKIINSNSKLVSRGAYIIKKEINRLDGIIIATGSEVKQAINISEELKNQNLDLRVVSMPSVEIFSSENTEYQKEIIPLNTKVVVLEPSSKLGWGQFTKKENIIGIDDFGFSGSSEEILNKMNYNYESLKLQIAKIFLSKE